MTRILITAVFLLFNLLVNAQEKLSDKNQIKVIVKNIPSKKGKIYFALYERNGFLSKKPFAKADCMVKKQFAEVNFDSIPNGNYAILYFLDKNNNK